MYSMAMEGKRVWFPILSRADHTRPAGGVNDSWWVRTESCAKANSDVSPYLIPNEWIAGRIAQFLCLPVPPFALVKTSGGRGMFASLKFTAADAPPPDTNPTVLCRDMAIQATGILIFDVLIANCDRHRGNLSVDDPDKPTRIRIFDHDRALLGFFPGEGIQRLKEMQTRLGISAGSVSGGNRHILLDAITTTEHFWEWIGRIKRLPDWYIDDACRYCIGAGVTKRESTETAQFLKDRRDTIDDILIRNSAEFVGVTKRGLFF